MPLRDDGDIQGCYDCSGLRRSVPANHFFCGPMKSRPTWQAQPSALPTPSEQPVAFHLFTVCSSLRLPFATVRIHQIVNMFGTAPSSI